MESQNYKPIILSSTRPDEQSWVLSLSDYDEFVKKLENEISNTCEFILLEQSILDTTELRVPESTC